MAGVHVEISRDTATPALAKAIAALEGDGLQLMLDDIGEHVLISTKARGKAQRSPDGSPFRPLSPEYAREKEKERPGKPILEFDYHMLGDQLSHQVVGDAVFIGTNAVYGATHQFGRITYFKGHQVEIPARPWLGLSDEDEDEVLAIARDHLAGMFSE